MAPSPDVAHQSTIMNLGACLRNFFRGKPCRVLAAPMDVKLAEDTVVQPDVMVVCDAQQNKGSHIAGPPALVVEVHSKSTWRHDRLRKLHLYAQYGVCEYWMITPYPPLVEVMLLGADGYFVSRAVYSETDTLTSPSFPGLRIELSEVFDFPVPPAERIDEVHEGNPGYGTSPAIARGPVDTHP